ncbi:MAG: hypothetical protein HY999_01480 [Nitrospinae bacterium]|nr:hypothetical protein [Nitrospinota bacterium]
MSNNFKYSTRFRLATLPSDQVVPTEYKHGFKATYVIVEGVHGFTPLYIGHDNTVRGMFTRRFGIVDNMDFDYIVSETGTWIPQPSGFAYGPDYRYAKGGGDSDTATWPAELISGSGIYEVFAWWVPNKDDNATNAPFTITHNGATNKVEVDQAQDGIRWFSFGGFYFAGNGEEGVTLSDDGVAEGKHVIADAVKFVFLGNVVDNADTNQFTTLGTWDTAPPPPSGVISINNIYATNPDTLLNPPTFHYHLVTESLGGTGDNTATWTPNLTEGGGYYRVFVRYPALSLEGAPSPYKLGEVPFTVNYTTDPDTHNPASMTVEINQNTHGGDWVDLNPNGLFYFADDGINPENVVLSDLGVPVNQYILADAVRFEKQDHLVSHSDELIAKSVTQRCHHHGGSSNDNFIVNVGIWYRAEFTVLRDQYGALESLYVYDDDPITMESGLVAKDSKYIPKVQKNPTGWTPDFPFPGHDDWHLSIGAQGGGETYYFDGDIDWLAIATKSLVWLFDEGVGQTTNEAIGYSDSTGVYNMVLGNNNDPAGESEDPVWTDQTDPGRFGNALVFTKAENDRVTRPYTGIIGSIRGPNPTGNKLTVESWIKPKSEIMDSYSNTILTSGWDSGYTLETYYRKLRFRICGQSFTMSSSLINTFDVWHHVAAVWNGDEHRVKLYYDGVETDSFFAPITYNEGTSQFEIGNRGINRGFPGVIDEVRISDAALSPEQLGYNRSIAP